MKCQLCGEEVKRLYPIPKTTGSLETRDVCRSCSLRAGFPVDSQNDNQLQRRYNLMETEQNQIESKPEVQEESDPLDAPVGTADTEKLAAEKVIIKEVKLAEKTKKDTDKIVGKILELMCKHPDKEELIKINKVVYIEDSVVKEPSLWYNKDKDGNVQKGSGIARLIDFVRVKTMRNLVGKEVQTSTGKSGYLCIKAY